MADLERIVNAATGAAKEAIKAEVVDQMRPHVERAKNGFAEVLGVGQSDEDEDEDGEGDDEDALLDRADLTYIFGMDGSIDEEEASSLAVAVWRTLAAVEGKTLSHWIAIHDDGYAACGPSATLEDELIARSEAAGIDSAGWEIHDDALDILAMDYDVSDIADFADELCSDDDEMDEQVEVHNGFNWEHDAKAIAAMEIPGVSAGWQIGHALSLDTSRGKLDWDGKTPLPFAIGIGKDAIVIHGANVQSTPGGVKVGDTSQSYADWKLAMDRKFDADDVYEIDGVKGAAYLMGDAKRFDYRSNKDQADPAKFDEYTHEHGEESGDLPSVFAIGPRSIVVCGGNMHIAPEGVRD